jgi:hypothetical protein
MEKPDWNSLLQQALTLPGTLSKAYSVFHDYSLGNAILAAFQLAARGLPLAPIASFNRWKNLGRKVRKGEKALSLIMPVTIKRKTRTNTPWKRGLVVLYMIFLLKRNWFSLDQTEGDVLQPEVWTPEWDKAKALVVLDIREVPFEIIDGNCQGYAKRGVREVAVNPVAGDAMEDTFPRSCASPAWPHGHGVTRLGVMADGPTMPKCIKEAEAEATAYLCCATLGLPGMEESRGYIQSWLDGRNSGKVGASGVCGGGQDSQGGYPGLEGGGDAR